MNRKAENFGLEISRSSRSKTFLETAFGMFKVSVEEPLLSHSEQNVVNSP